MKKVLLATSILAASTGFAAAEVALSGSARMGVIYDGADYAFSSRVRVVFTMSGETDGGLAFGASMRADQFGGNGGVTFVAPGPDGLPGTADDVVSTAGGGGTSNGDSTVFISGDFGKLTMGDVGGAADALVGQTSGVGYGPNDGLQEINFIGTTKTAAYYEYSSGPFTVGLGAGQPTSAGSEVNIGAKYAMGDYTFAIGYEQSDVSIYEDMISASASAKFGGATVKAKIADPGAAGADTAYSISVDYTTGATTITGFYTDFGNTGLGGGTVVGVDTQHVGLGAAYDLGGGATLAGGIVQQMTPAGDTTFGDVGVKFSF